MFSQLAIKISERMHGRKLAAVIAERSGGSVTERTVRNWLGRRTTPDAVRIARFQEGRRRWLQQELEGKGWPQAQREALARDIDASPGILNAIALSMHAPGGHYPAFVRRSRELDAFEETLADLRGAGDLPGWVWAVLETPWISDAHLADPFTPAMDAQVMRSAMLAADSWKALEYPLQVLIFNCQLELLATLDLEFCSRYLCIFEAAPVFASLQPRLDPRIDLGGAKEFPVTRDAYHYPARRLLDAAACLCVRRRRHRWPDAVPAVEDMMRWLDTAGRITMASNLPKWRSGRPLTAERFAAFWEAGCDFLPEREQPPVPLAMLYAASVFTELFVKGSREEQGLRFIVPDPAIYQGWWERQRRAMAEGPEALRFGSEPWMPGLA